jgi:hypothetical protein
VTDPIEALENEAARTGDFLATLSDEDWARPTRCPPMNVRELAVHTLRAGMRLIELVGAPVVGEPEKDILTYYRFDTTAVGFGVVERAQHDTAQREGTDLTAEWRTAFAAAAAAARE